MYEIKLDLDTLYNPLLADEGLAITEGSIDLELDSAGTATISIPKTNALYDTIGRMRQTIRAYNDGVEIFTGRILHDKQDFFGEKRLTIEGLLACFIDCIMPPHNIDSGTVAEYFTYVIGIYNTQVDPYRRLTVGDITITDASTPAVFTAVEYETIQDTIYNNIINVYGGHLRLRTTNNIQYIDLLGSYTDICTQPIEFGRNLVDLDKSIYCDDIVTVVIPLGAMQYDTDGNPIGRVNITSVTTGGVEYVTDLPAATLYGNIWRSVIWEEITDPAELKTLGEQYLAEHKTASTTITISAVDLHAINVNAEMIMLGDKVRVISAPHGIDDYFQCTGIHIDLLDPGRSIYTFGPELKTISEMQASTMNTMEEGSAEEMLRYIELSGRIAAVEASQRITTTEETTIEDIFDAAKLMAVSHIYLGAEVTDKPHAYGGTLVIYKLTAYYGTLIYYCNNGEIYKALMDNGTLSAWRKIQSEALS